MPRVKRGTKRRARRKKYLKRTKGFFLTKSKLYQSAQEAANRADRYAKRDRRVKKRQYRRLWIQRVGAAARLNGITYGQLIHGLKAAGVDLDRKVLADIAVKDAAAFALARGAGQSRRAAAEKRAKRVVLFLAGCKSSVGRQRYLGGCPGSPLVHEPGSWPYFFDHDHCRKRHRKTLADLGVTQPDQVPPLFAQ